MYQTIEHTLKVKPGLTLTSQGFELVVMHGWLKYQGFEK